MDINIIKKLKVVELKAALGERGLSIKGKKDELVKRLVEAMEADEEPQKEEEVENEPEPEPETEVAEEAMETEESAQNDLQSQEIATEGASVEPVEEVKESEKETSEEEVIPSSTTSADVPEHVKPSDNESTDAAPTDKSGEDWVLVEPPTADEINAVNEASTKQDEAVKETQEAAVPESTSSGDVEMKEDKKDDTTEAKPEDSKTEAKTEEVKSPEAKKEEPKEEEIKDEMVAVEDEEGEEFVLCEVPDGKVGLDQYSSDINLVISNNGLKATPLSKNGFSYLWAGARGNRGVKGGKIGYEVKITGKNEVDLPESETLHHAIRIGWSSEQSGMQLGESSSSYGFESTGKVCASSSFYTYGTSFGEGDVIGTYLDLESEPKSLRYTKNGQDLGVAMSLTINLDEKPLFPHILVRNMSVELNFGDNETPFNETPEGFTLLQNGNEEQTINMVQARIPDEEQPEVIMLVGLPSSGKSTWAKKYQESNSDKMYNVISLQNLLDRSKLEGKSRQKDDKGFKELMTALIKVMTKLYQLCPKRRRNFIYDQTNVYQKAQIEKMEPFTGFKRKAVVIVPTHDLLRRRTSDSKRRNENIHEVPFGDLCDMKCRFNIPEKGELFDEVSFPELDEKNATKTVHDYHSDGQRAKRTGRDEYYPKKKGRYDDRRSGDRRHYGGGGNRDYRRDDYNRYGGGSGGRRDDRHGDKRRYDDRRSSGGSNYGRQNYGSGGHYRNNSGGYNSGYGQNYNSGGYGQNYNMGGQNYGGAYNYNYQQYGNQSANRGQWQQGQQQYYVQQQGQQQQQQWGQWGNYYNTGGSGSNNYGSGGYSY